MPPKRGIERQGSDGLSELASTASTRSTKASDPKPMHELCTEMGISPAIYDDTLEYSGGRHTESPGEEPLTHPAEVEGCNEGIRSETTHPDVFDDWVFTDNLDEIVLEYPAFTGKNLPVSRGDVQRLLSGQCLSDPLIELGLSIFCEQLQDKDPVLRDKVLVLSQFFFSTLINPLKGYDTVIKWFKNTDPFSYPFIICPIHMTSVDPAIPEQGHWWLAIILGSALIMKMGDSAEDQTEGPIFLALDSLGDDRTCELEKLYDFFARYGRETCHYPATAKSREECRLANVDVPLQTNNVDCGVYMLKNAQVFLGDMASAIYLIKKGGEYMGSMWRDVEYANARAELGLVVQCLCRVGEK